MPPRAEAAPGRHVRSGGPGGLWAPNSASVVAIAE